MKQKNIEKQRNNLKKYIKSLTTTEPYARSVEILEFIRNGYQTKPRSLKFTFKKKKALTNGIKTYDISDKQFLISLDEYLDDTDITVEAKLTAKGKSIIFSITDELEDNYPISSIAETIANKIDSNQFDFTYCLNSLNIDELNLESDFNPTEFKLE